MDTAGISKCKKGLNKFMFHYYILKNMGTVSNVCNLFVVDDSEI